MGLPVDGARFEDGILTALAASAEEPWVGIIPPRSYQPPHRREVRLSLAPSRRLRTQANSPGRQEMRARTVSRTPVPNNPCRKPPAASPGIVQPPDGHRQVRHKRRQYKQKHRPVHHNPDPGEAAPMSRESGAQCVQDSQSSEEHPPRQHPPSELPSWHDHRKPCSPRASA